MKSTKRGAGHTVGIQQKLASHAGVWKGHISGCYFLLVISTFVEATWEENLG